MSNKKKKKRKNKYKNKEIASHSSMLHNDRLGKLFDIAADQRMKFGSFNRINLPDQKKFLSTIGTIYRNSSPAIPKENCEKIMDILKEARKMVNGGWYPDSVENAKAKNKVRIKQLFYKIDKAYAIIIASLQEYQYFFRIQNKERRGFEAGLDTFEDDEEGLF